MFIIRTAFWLGIIVMLMPSDKEAQGRMAAAAENGYKQISTVCDRYPAACQQGSAAWAVFKAKAQVAGRIVFDLAMDQMAPRKASGAAAAAESREPAGQSAPKAAPGLGRTAAIAPSHADHPRGHSGTLRPDDVVPAWRAEAQRGRL